ncbi:autotransporter outer membrane beta-barrel domain-containing protein [Campylobacter sp. MIT 99-7217]|uniref:autotransporter outer membrane beta-barrel domain-containing protein n=1 Tax=Campylobacter sp. MIT 99-7217 TaxID=535091 RepID=UPI00115BA86F|nr:autotransporter outer membrane beta-barrel domain-containing protein [Campylobacter sp. MIT 99-7217]TQR32400.1 autotransporter outer membrane beta-barrel domain-containing protein [Campylobacter sp. MIT 99-7217]
MKRRLKKKIFLSFSVASLLYTTSFGADFTLTNQTNINDYFDVTNKTTSLKNSYKNDNLKINFQIDDFPEVLEDTANYSDYALNINLDKQYDLELVNNHSGGVYLSNLSATANDISVDDISLYIDRASVINANLYLSGTTTPSFNNTGKESSIEVYNGNLPGMGNLRGDLLINGDFEAEKTSLWIYGTSIRVSQNAHIENSLFIVPRLNFSDLEFSNTTLMQAKSFNDLSSNEANILLFKNLLDHVDEATRAKLSLYDVKTLFARVDFNDILGAEKFLNYNLAVVDCAGQKCLVMSSKLNDLAKNPLNQVKLDIKSIESLIEAGDEDLAGGETQAEWDLAKKSLENEKIKLEDLIDKAEASGGLFDDEAYVNLVAPNLSTEDKTAVLALRSIASALPNGIGADLVSRGGIELAKNIKENTENTGKSVSNLNSSVSGVNTSMNVANDVSIGQRVAMLNNPYGNYASKLSKLRFASSNKIASDMKMSYVSENSQSIWANVFGGNNIIDGNSGAMTGATVGAEKIGENALWGIYFSYANAKIKDKNLEQKSDNFQVGIYSNFTFASDMETHIKIYTQVSPTRQNSLDITGVYEADFMGTNLGLSANLGKLFGSESFSVKPFVGANYYLSHTPRYTQAGLIAKNIDKITNNSISAELGAELRAYMSESSYFFASPKIEQFVYNEGGDYTANLAVNNAFFTSVEADNKKKTYAQLILGGSIDFSEKFSANLGLGAKQILAGKVDKKNETYLSGQLGLKYNY